MGVYCSMPMTRTSTVPTTKLRSLNRLGRKIGAGAVAMWIANMIANTTATMASAMISGDWNQSLRWPRSNISWAPAIARAMKMKPTWSKRCAVPFSRSVSAKITVSAAITPSGRMRKNVQRQFKSSDTRPPNVGPRIGPITPPTPHIMMMKGCWLR